MADPRAELSLVEDNGADYGSSCGYCGGSRDWYSHGMSVRRNLSVYPYQDLIDQGWRRSGRYLYKPNLARSCCKAYTIRLDVRDFTLDKGQRRLLRKWREFLAGQNTTASGPSNPAAPSGKAASASPRGRRPAAAHWATGSAAPAPHAAASSAAAASARPTAAGTSQASSAGRSEVRHDPAGAGSCAAGAGHKATSVAAEEAALEATGQELQRLLAGAVAAALAAGELPPGVYPDPVVRRCTAKQQHAVGADVLFTSAAAFAIAAAAARAGGAKSSSSSSQGPSAAGHAPPSAATVKHGIAASPGSSPGHPGHHPTSASAPARLHPGVRPEDVAAVLVRHFNSRTAAAAATTIHTGTTASITAAHAASPGSTAAAASGPSGGPPVASAANGHINFRLPTAQQSGGSGKRPAESMEAGAHQQAVRAAAGHASPSTAGGGGGKGGPAAAERQGQSAQRPAPKASTEPSAGPADAAAAAGGGPADVPCSDAELLHLPRGRLEIRLVPSTFLEEEYQLYTRYQVAQHHDSPSHLSRDSYTRFLVDSPLRPVGRNEDPEAPDCGYGSFHQQYWLDGKLIAVGVVDVLPRCLSSVYFFWDTTLPSLALGKFSALQEILWVMEHMPSSPRLHYYYMGFYIHTCPKMRYKADYRPSDLLCPERKVWVRITPQLLAALERRPYLVLSAEEGALCLPNLAAPPGDPASLPTAAANVAQLKHAGPGLRGLAAGRGGPGGSRPEEDLGDVRVVVPTRRGPMLPVIWQEAVSSKLILPLYMENTEEQLRAWKAVVGWAAPALLYQL